MRIVAFILAVSIVPGCSAFGDVDRLTEDEYQQRIRMIVEGDDARVAGTLFFDAVATPYGRDECARRMRALYARVRAILDDVDELEPPRQAEDAHDDFVDAASESVDRVGEVADAVEAGDLRCGRALNARLYGMPSTARAE